MRKLNIIQCKKKDSIMFYIYEYIFYLWIYHVLLVFINCWWKITFCFSKKDHVDPPITPSKVLMVHRVKPWKGNPYWEKDILTDLGFEERVIN